MSIKIILVDDHELLRKGLISLLGKRDNIEVVGEAANGSDAIALAESLNPDVIILDIEMPDIDGIQAAREISRKCPESKILALSRHSERDFVADMFSVGAKGYLLKDSAPNELVQAIETVADNQKYISQSLMDVVLEGLTSKTSAHEESDTAILTAREKEILIMVANGKSSKEIAFDLGLSGKTVDTHRQQIMRKLQIFSIAELTKYALKHGLIKL